VSKTRLVLRQRSGAPSTLGIESTAPTLSRWHIAQFAQLAHIRVLWVPSTQSTGLTRARVIWGIAGLFAVGHAAVFAWLSPLALQDLPNHLARARVLADILFERGTRFGDLFELHLLPVPYVLGDLILATATHLLGVTGAAVFWSVSSFASLPCALWYYLGATRLRPDSKALLVLLSSYLSTDWFFLVGFIEFRLGVALTLVVLGLAERFRTKPTAAWLLVYTVALSAGYLTHLTTLVFVSALAGTTSLLRLVRRTSRVPVELALLLPCAALLLWHFGFTGAYRHPDDLVENPYIWGTVAGKLARVIAEFQRYNPRPDLLMWVIFATTVTCYVGRLRWRDLRTSAGFEFLVMASAMLAVYCILPAGYSEAYYVDVRALPFLSLYVLLTFLGTTPREDGKPAGRQTLALILAVTLVAGNMVYLAAHMHRQKQWLDQYRSVISKIPRGAYVLPVYTHAPEGEVVPFLHAFAFAAIDRDAVVPYLQTGDTGNPQKYLRYRHRPDAPDQLWYGNLPPSPVEWRRVACEYRFLLVTKPFDPARLALTTSLVAENNSASLLAISKPAFCGPHGVN